MTREEINALDMQALEERAAAIAEETREASIETLDALSEELDMIEERKKAIIAQAEEKREKMLDVLEGAGEEIEEIKEERKTMEKVEVRSTPEYLTAWVSDALGHANAEQRALLTENVEGTVAVPTYVEDVIHTAWESNEILRRIRRTYYPGNLKIGYEISATGAVMHLEGTDPITEETLSLGIVNLIPIMIKKFISYSDEAGDISPEFARYIVDEITDKIIKGVIQMAIHDMEVSQLTDYVYAGDGATLTTVSLINAAGLLGGEASDPVIITTRSNAAALKAAALGANYGYDPFDGMDVLYVDGSMFDENVDTLAIVADLSGVLVNFPNGDDVRIKVDELTAAASDLVKVYGRLYAAAGVVAPGKVVAIVAQDEG